MITYQLFESGFCRHCERMTLKKGSMKQREYPSICVLIKHPNHGYILFDAGYHEHFFQATRYFPFSLYRYLTPVVLKKSLKEQLMEQGIQPSDIKYLVISHFHADHIGGLCDFPEAQFICHQEALDDIRHKNRYRALLQGFLPNLLPKNFHQRTQVLHEQKIKLDAALYPFTEGYDLFGDQQLIAIELPGHAKGQIGLYLKGDPDVFFVADSCWHQEAFMELNLPSNITYLVHDNKEQYIKTINNLHVLYNHNKSIKILPTHCEHTRSLISGDIL